MIDFGQRLDHLHWGEAQLGLKFDPRAATWLTSVSQSGSILGIAIFSRFTTGNCEITVASSTPHFITPRFARAVYAYLFLQLDCRRVTAFIAVDNVKSLSLAQQLGFRIEGLAREWFPTSDAHILGLLRGECKLIKDTHGQTIRPGST